MVHISDGVLSWEVAAAGWVISCIFLALSLRRFKVEEVPKISLITAAFFTASLIHVSVGPTSVHLLLNGLVGVVIGPLSYISIFIGLILQALLLGHGGIVALGVNSMDMGLPALLAYFVFRSLKEKNPWIAGGLAGGLAVAFSALLTGAVIYTTGEEFIWAAYSLLTVHIPIIIVEVVVVAFAVSFLLKVKPELLCCKVEE